MGLKVLGQLGVPRAALEPGMGLWGGGCGTGDVS